MNKVKSARYKQYTEVPNKQRVLLLLLFIHLIYVKCSFGFEFAVQFIEGECRSADRSEISTGAAGAQISSGGTLLLIFGGIFALQALPTNVLSSLSYSQFLLLAIAIAAVLDAVLLGLSLVSFQRSRLITLE